MVRNLNLRLPDGSEKKIWVDDTFVSESLLKRLFRALNKASNISEAIELLKQVNFNEGYNKDAKFTYLFRYGNSKVKCQLCNYDEMTDTFKRGKFINVVELK